MINFVKGERLGGKIFIKPYKIPDPCLEIYGCPKGSSSLVA